MSGWSGPRTRSRGGEDVAVLGLGPGVIPPLCHHPGDLVPGGQRVRVVGAQHPQPGGEDVPVFGLGRGVIPLRGHLQGDLVPGGQRVRVVGAQHPQPGVEDVPEFGLGPGVIPPLGHLQAISCRVASVSGWSGPSTRSRAARTSRTGFRLAREALELPGSGPPYEQRMRHQLHRVVRTSWLRGQAVASRCVACGASSCQAGHVAGSSARPVLGGGGLSQQPAASSGRARRLAGVAGAAGVADQRVQPGYREGVGSSSLAARSIRPNCPGPCTCHSRGPVMPANSGQAARLAGCSNS